MQEDHKVFAHHDKWGTFQVPKAFLNMNNNAPAAVAPKAVRQASGAHACSLTPCGTALVAQPALLYRLRKVLSDSYTYASALLEFLYIGTPPLHAASPI